MQQLLIIGGVLLLLAGVTFPWWSRAAQTLWGLPGNIVIKRGHFSIVLSPHLMPYCKPGVDAIALVATEVIDIFPKNE